MQLAFAIALVIFVSLAIVLTITQISFVKWLVYLIELAKGRK